MVIRPEEKTVEFKEKIFMTENTGTKVMGWPAIIAILIGVAFVAGLLVGLLGSLLNLSPSARAGGVGAAVGVTAATLIARRRAAMSGRSNR